MLTFSISEQTKMTKYQIGKMDIKQRLEVKNQNIPNQESILANVWIIICYIANVFVLIKMNK